MYTDTSTPPESAVAAGLHLGSAAEPARPLHEESRLQTPAPYASSTFADVASSDAAPPASDSTPALDASPAAGDAAPAPASPAALAQQIAEHPDLPPAMRQALAALVARHGQLAQGTVQLAVADLVPVLAQALPAFLRRDPARLEVAEHPAGDGFFESLSGELSEAQAERLARAQLAASGLLRGQTVRAGV